MAVYIDGRKHSLEGGPKSASGRLLATLHVRESGHVSDVVIDVEVHPTTNDELLLTVDRRNTRTGEVKLLHEEMFKR